MSPAGTALPAGHSVTVEDDLVSAFSSAMNEYVAITRCSSSSPRRRPRLCQNVPLPGHPLELLAKLADLARSTIVGPSPDSRRARAVPSDVKHLVMRRRRHGEQ